MPVWPYYSREAEGSFFLSKALGVIESACRAFSRRASQRPLRKRADASLKAFGVVSKPWFKCQARSAGRSLSVVVCLTSSSSSVVPISIGWSLSPPVQSRQYGSKLGGPLALTWSHHATCAGLVLAKISHARLG